MSRLRAAVADTKYIRTDLEPTSATFFGRLQTRERVEGGSGADVFRVSDGRAEMRHVPEGCRLVAGAAGGAERAASPQGDRQKSKLSSNSRPTRADEGHADLGVSKDVAAIGGVSPANK